MSDVPVLVIGLRRVGGTSFVQFLSQVSSHPTLEHEPFNTDRMLGHLTQTYDMSGDLARLKADIGQALTPVANIKHCIETVPFAVSQALIEACVEKGYAIMVLTRRDESRRLLSLFLAFATGVWDGVQARERYPDILAGRRFVEPFDLAALANQRRSDAVALCRLLTFLRYRGISYEWLVFEELFQEKEPVEAKARRVAGRLGIAVRPDDPRLAVLARGEGRASSAVLERVPNIAAARALLASPEWYGA